MNLLNYFNIAYNISKSLIFSSQMSWVLLLKKYLVFDICFSYTDIPYYNHYYYILNYIYLPLKVNLLPSSGVGVLF